MANLVVLDESAATTVLTSDAAACVVGLTEELETALMTALSVFTFPLLETQDRGGIVLLSDAERALLLLDEQASVQVVLADVAVLG